MSAKIANGTIRTINGQQRIYYDGYWIRHYEVPHNLAYKKELIDQLTRRVFRHTEPGINTPGDRLEAVREAYNCTEDPARKRVLAAMLAGALLNRGSEILTKVVELEELGVVIQSSNELLRECGRCFMGALEYGKYIHPLHGHEELDELWGEPFKAFTMPVGQFLETRYLKMAHAMRDIDSIADNLISLFELMQKTFPGIPERLRELKVSAKLAIETMRSDPEIINVWPRLIGAKDTLEVFQPLVPDSAPQRDYSKAKRGLQLLKDGAELIVDICSIRVPKPKSTALFIERCHDYSKKYIERYKQAS
jgi:hypothetical protein